MKTIGKCFLLFSFPTLVQLGCGKKIAPEKVTLVVTSWFADKLALYRKEVFDPFEREHPNIEVNLQFSIYGDYFPKLLVSTASGSHFGDVVQVDDAYAAELFERDYAIDLSAFVKRDLKLEDFNIQDLRLWRRPNSQGDELLGFPPWAGVTVLFYNKDIFDAEHSVYPDSTWTYDDFLRVARKLTKDFNHDGIVDQWGFDLRINNFLQSIVYSFGGSFLNPKTRQAEIDMPTSIAAIRFIGDLSNKYKVAPRTLPYQGVPPFVAGKAAMLIEGDFHVVYFKDVSFRWGIAPVPKGPAGKFSRRYGSAFCIPKTSKHPKEAWELIKWIVTYPPRTKTAEIFNGMIPTYRPLAHSDEWTKSYGPDEARVLLETYEKYSFSPVSRGWMEWCDLGIVPYIEDVIAGRRSAEEAARASAARVNEMVGKK
ncbi:MAG: sugar ABC transporter substrate-binding protein [Bacteroidota bacterium]